MATDVALLPSLKFPPEVTRVKITVKYSSDSTKSSGLTVTETHFSVPLAEPMGKVTGNDNWSKSPPSLLAANNNDMFERS